MTSVEAPSIRNTILCGDVRSMLRLIPDESVNCVVTSPPYWGLRDYGVDGQLGLEATPEEFVWNLVDVFREVRRVLREDGTVWLNLGDSYCAGGNGARDPERWPKQSRNADGFRATHAKSSFPGLKPKDMVGIPWRVAFALQADGWWLRSDIIWSKPNPMPESVTDRPTKSHEYIFLLSKSATYYYDAEAIRESFADERMGNPGVYQKTSAGERKAVNDRQDLGFLNNGGGWNADGTRQGRNKRTVWEVATEPYAEAHFATFPTALVKPCTLAGCPEGGIVLDPFLGSGTTALVAKVAGRDYIGIELNPEYVELAKRRINVDQERML